MEVKGISGNYNIAELHVSQQMLFWTEDCETDMHIQWLKIYQQNIPQLHNAQKKTRQHKALQDNYTYIIPGAYEPPWREGAFN